MAGNILNKNPLVFDTVGATSAITSPLIIKGLFWVSSSVAGKDIAALDELQIHDAVGGNLIISKRAEAAGDGLEIIFSPLMVAGFYLTTMAGGILYVYT